MLMKKLVFGVLLIATALCLQAQTLTWEVKFLRGKTQESVPVTRPVRMESGDSFIITVRPDEDCYCYVVSHDSERKLYILKNEFVKGGIEIYLDTIEITDPPGTETVYVIMSLERQTMLESLIRAYNNNPDTQQDANNLYREVINLQNKTANLGEPASSFITSGGTSRGGGEKYATRFSDKDLYVRPIVIRH